MVQIAMILILLACIASLIALDIRYAWALTEEQSGDAFLAVLEFTLKKNWASYAFLIMGMVINIALM